MARVNIEGRALAESRFHHFRTELEMSRSQALGILAIFWHDSQEKLFSEAAKDQLLKFIDAPKAEREKIFSAMVENEYLTDNGKGSFTIHGNRRQIEYLLQKRAAASRGGLASGESRKKLTKPNTTKHVLKHPRTSPVCDPIRSEAIRSDPKRSEAEEESGERKPSAAASPPAVEHNSFSPLCDPVVTDFLMKNAVKPLSVQLWLRTYPDRAWVEHEILKAIGWVAANPHRAPRSRFVQFLASWLARGWERHRKNLPVQKTAPMVLKFD